MKLYLLCDDTAVRKRWSEALAEFDPSTSAEFPVQIEPHSIVMVLDRFVADADEMALGSLFRHRVMIFSMNPNFSEAQRFLQRGALGYGNAMMHFSHLQSAYQTLEEGKVWLHPDFISLMITQIREAANAQERSQGLLEELSKREQEVALMLGNGATHQQIADALDITVRTVKAHATSIYQKLGVKDRLALSLFLHSQNSSL